MAFLPRLIIHGGAWDWDDALDAPKTASLHRALSIGWEALQAGRGALQAVEKAVNWLEDDPLFDAGTGSHLNVNGVVEMDALLIDAESNQFGAVGAVTRVRHPITLARKIMTETKQQFIVGAGADEIAAKLGMRLIPNIALVSEAEKRYFLEGRTDGTSDTVGAIAIDQDGHIAVANSTGGTPLKPAGRIGDTPIFGAGGYADKAYGGAAATGRGEHAMRLMLSRYVVDAIQAGKTANEAAQDAIQHAEARIPNSMLGTITVDVHGNIGAAHSTPKLACGWIDADGNPQVTMRGGIVQKATG